MTWAVLKAPMGFRRKWRPGLDKEEQTVVWARVGECREWIGNIVRWLAASGSHACVCYKGKTAHVIEHVMHYEQLLSQVINIFDSLPQLLLAFFPIPILHITVVNNLVSKTQSWIPIKLSMDILLRSASISTPWILAWRWSLTRSRVFAPPSMICKFRCQSRNMRWRSCWGSGFGDFEHAASCGLYPHPPPGQWYRK